MNTYLLLWNPNKWDWTSLESDIREIEVTGRSSQRWSCGVTKSIRSGDRLFLLRAGKDPRGIIGSGFSFTEPFYDRHWSGEDRETLFIQVDFDVLLNSEIEPVLDISELESDFPSQNWHPQASGTSVKSEIVERLEFKWFEFLNHNSIRNNPFLNQTFELKETYSEGSPVEVKLTRYERNPYARKKCIDYYGFSCIVCGFNFEKKYGEHGKDYVQVHHLEQIAHAGKTYEIDPIDDLRPVCANCHAMIHRKKKALTIQEAQDLLKI